MNPKVILPIVYGTAGVFIVVLLIVFKSQLSQTFDLRTICMMAIAFALLAGANTAILSKTSDPVPVRYVVASNSVTFIVVGLTSAVLICKNWQTATLLAGSCLLVGGFVGLLFGYPQGVAQKRDQSPVPVIPPPAAGAPIVPPSIAPIPAASATLNPPPAPDTPAAPPPIPPTVAPSTPRAQNLVAESAATLGKVITGFTLAKLTDAIHYFEGLIRFIGPALGCPDVATSPVVAGVLMAYFLATGFLSGLFLPSYFMSDVIS